MKTYDPFRPEHNPDDVEFYVEEMHSPEAIEASERWARKQLEQAGE